MGVSTDAMLCFGVDPKWEGEFPWVTDDNDTEDGDYDKWLNELMETDNHPLRIVAHCCEAEPMYLVAVKKLNAYRGYPKEIRMADLSIEREEVLWLQEFCKRAGVEYKPAWFLASWWG